jgi:calcineurin-like phosphoesterase family protein
MSQRRQLLFTSDWHIGHESVLSFSNRPFPNLEKMHSSLIKSYNAMATEKTTGYFLGDMGLGNQSITKEVVNQLKGTKVLVLGNHDKNHNAMYNMGFDVVLNSASIYICKQLVTLTHCPLIGLYRENTIGMKHYVEGDNWHGESRKGVEKFAIPNNGQFHLHGHIHSPNGGKSTRIAGRQLDVGVDANNYRPLTISNIEKFIQNTLSEETKGATK